MKLPKIIAETSFNYGSDKREFGTNERIVTIASMIEEENKSKLLLSFNLGRKESDEMILEFDTEEFMQKLAEAIIFREEY